MSQRTSSPISDPEPNYASDVVVPKPPEDPVENDKIAFKQDKKYSHVLKILEDRQEALRQEISTKPEGMSYQEFGMMTEVNSRIAQELENFKTDIELTYELRKQQS